MEHGLEKNLINQHVGLFFLLETGRLCPSVLLNFLLAKLCWTERVPSRDFGPFDPQRGAASVGNVSCVLGVCVCVVELVWRSISRSDQEGINGKSLLTRAEC